MVYFTTYWDATELQMQLSRKKALVLFGRLKIQFVLRLASQLRRGFAV